MAKFQGAVIKEQGVKFAIVVVKSHVVQVQHEALKAIDDFGRFFPGIPVILMAQNGRGTPTYYGRRDIAKFMSNVPIQAIPWKEYTVS
ncbi:MAG: hypothetical protein OEL83_07205 [Desulforhopalus sp.]|jgi:hypothetical protein|nr:hypothetical protein [Desulforhopalus sp.]